MTNNLSWLPPLPPKLKKEDKEPEKKTEPEKKKPFRSSGQPHPQSLGTVQSGFPGSGIRPKKK